MGSELVERFAERFGTAAEVLVDTPGRVNLIGEHTDYNGLPVLPIAIDRGVRIAAAARRDRMVELGNLDARYPNRRYPVATPIANGGDGDWGNYHKAAVSELLMDRPGWPGGSFLVAGDLPAAAGLASSSALVVASGFAFLALAGIDLPRPELATRLARAECHAGPMSGGMDQAVSLLATAGHALRIDFFPLATRPLPLPPGVAIVVCHSLVPAAKAQGARAAYNRRVIECRLACVALAASLGQPLARLGDLRHHHPDRRLASFLPALGVADRSHTIEEVASFVGRDVDTLVRECGVSAEHRDGLRLWRRMRHVLSEGDRVEAAEGALRNGDASALGQLMDASHVSLAEDYEVSCPALDELVATARAAGALGARLTGAGFGGCTVSLVEEGNLEAFLAFVDREFYAKRQPEAREWGRHRFPVAAVGGARVTRIR